MHSRLRAGWGWDSTLGVGGTQPRGKYEDRLAGVVGRIGRDLDEVEELRGRGANVEIAAWDAEAGQYSRARLKVKARRQSSPR